MVTSDSNTMVVIRSMLQTNGRNPTLSSCRTSWKSRKGLAVLALLVALVAATTALVNVISGRAWNSTIGGVAGVVDIVVFVLIGVAIAELVDRLG